MLLADVFATGDRESLLGHRSAVTEDRAAEESSMDHRPSQSVQQTRGSQLNPQPGVPSGDDLLPPLRDIGLDAHALQPDPRASGRGTGAADIASSPRLLSDQQPIDSISSPPDADATPAERPVGGAGVSSGASAGGAGGGGGGLSSAVIGGTPVSFGASVDLSQFFRDDQQSSNSLSYALDSNDNYGTISASVSGHTLSVSATSGPGTASLVVSAGDNANLRDTWTITVYAVEVSGYEVQERAWNEAGFDAPQDSGADWNVLWTSDQHRWKPEILPAAVADRVMQHDWKSDAGYFAHAAWCVSASHANWEPWAYGSPRAEGETSITPRISFRSTDIDALLSIGATANLKPGASTSNAPRISSHAISSLEWQPVASPTTASVPNQSVPVQNVDLAFAELGGPTSGHPGWAAYPSASGTVTYDKMGAVATITPAIPLGMTGDLHLAWYDPINTVANVPTTPPTATTANAVRDNQATLTAVISQTLEFEHDESVKTGYYKINSPRFGDNFIVAAHPHDQIETEYEFDASCDCGGGEELKFEDYPAGCDPSQPTKPDFNQPPEQHHLAQQYQTPVLTVLPSVDVDSDNDDNYGSPDRDQIESDVEDIDGEPGKRLIANYGDKDGDGVPDRIDGYDLDGISGNEDDQNPNEQFVPLVIEISDLADLSVTKVMLDYQTAGLASTATGALRIWDLEQPSDAHHRIASDYLAPGTYSATDLGFFNGTRTRTFYLEAIQVSDVLGEDSITVRIDPDGTGPWGFAQSDTVRTTIAHPYNLLYTPVTASDLDDNDVDKIRRLTETQATAVRSSQFVSNP